MALIGIRSRRLWLARRYRWRRSRPRELDDFAWSIAVRVSALLIYTGDLKMNVWGRPSHEGCGVRLCSADRDWCDACVTSHAPVAKPRPKPERLQRPERRWIATYYLCHFWATAVLLLTTRSNDRSMASGVSSASFWRTMSTNRRDYSGSSALGGGVRLGTFDNERVVPEF